MIIMTVLAAALVAWEAPTDTGAVTRDVSRGGGPPAASATKRGVATWEGTCDLDRAASDDMDEVVDRIVSQVRQRARGQVESALRQRLEPSPWLRLSSDSATITIESDRGVVWRVQRSGTAAAGTGRAAGRPVPATVTDTEIVISGQGERGQGSYRLRRSTDGKQIEVTVSLSGERLKEPINYALVYRLREEGSAG